MKLLFIDNYDSFTYNIVHYFEVLGTENVVYYNDKITIKQILDYNPDYIVISPGPCSPLNAGISCEVILKLGNKIPILGVCLGHQAIAHVFGTKIIKALKPMHGKISKIYHDNSGLFYDIKGEFMATRYHSLIVDERSLAKCLCITARSEDGEIMAIKHKKYKIYGVQFHPESIASDHGYKIFDNFLKKK